MNLKKKTLYLLLGFCLGGMVLSIIDKLGSRAGNFGGEILFLPCVILLIWFGWTIHKEFNMLKKDEDKASNKSTGGKFESR